VNYEQVARYEHEGRGQGRSRGPRETLKRSTSSTTSAICRRGDVRRDCALGVTALTRKKWLLGVVRVSAVGSSSGRGLHMNWPIHPESAIKWLA
jgi:hypothetical protein